MKQKMANIEWHIRNNFIPSYPETTIEGMLKTIRKFYMGKLGINSPIVKGAKVTVGQLFEDLRIQVGADHVKRIN